MDILIFCVQDFRKYLHVMEESAVHAGGVVSIALQCAVCCVHEIEQCVW